MAESVIWYRCDVCEERYAEDYEAADCCPSGYYEDEIWECPHCNAEWTEEDDAEECCEEQEKKLPISSIGYVSKNGN